MLVYVPIGWAIWGKGSLAISLAIMSGLGPAIIAMAAISFFSIFLLSEAYTTDLADDRAEVPAAGRVGASDV